MKDVYLSCATKDTLEALSRVFVTRTCVLPGLAERTETDEEGRTTTLPAIGNPDLFYVCVRVTDEFPLLDFNGVSVVEDTLGSQIVGFFS